jgi:hypothetical protein
VVTTTDYFNAFQSQSGDKIPGLTLAPLSVHEIAKTALTLLQTSIGGGVDKPVKETELPADREFAVIELQSARANCPSPNTTGRGHSTGVQLGVHRKLRQARQFPGGRPKVIGGWQSKWVSYILASTDSGP